MGGWGVGWGCAVALCNPLSICLGNVTSGPAYTSTRMYVYALYAIWSLTCFELTRLQHAKRFDTTYLVSRHHVSRACVFYCSSSVACPTSLHVLFCCSILLLVCMQRCTCFMLYPSDDLLLQAFFSIGSCANVALFWTVCHVH